MEIGIGFVDCCKPLDRLLVFSKSETSSNKLLATHETPNCLLEFCLLVMANGDGVLYFQIIGLKLGSNAEISQGV